MAVIHISEEQFATDLASVLSKARAGEDIVIDDDSGSLRLSRAVPPKPRDPLTPRYTEPRLISEILADLSKNPGSGVTLDDKFGDDLEAIIKSHEHERLIDPWESF